MNNSQSIEEIEVFGSRNQYKIRKTLSIMEMEIDFSKQYKGIFSILNTLFYAIILITIYGIYILYPPNGLLEISLFGILIIILIYFSFLSFYFFYLYIYNKNRFAIFTFDKEKNSFIFKKNKNKQKKFLKVPLTEVEKINYFHRTGGYLIKSYYLTLILMNNKKVKIISGADSIEDLKNIYENLSKFLDIPIINIEPRTIKDSLIMIFIFGLLIYFSVFLPFSLGIIWFATIFAYFIFISIVIIIIGPSVYFKLKKNKFSRKIH